MTMFDSIQKGDVAITLTGYITIVKQVEILPSDREDGLLRCEYEGSCICDFFRPDQLKEIKKIGPRIRPKRIFSFQLCKGDILKTKLIATQDSTNEEFFFAYTLDGHRRREDDFHFQQIDSFDCETKRLLSFEEDENVILRQLRTAISFVKDEKIRKELEAEISSATFVENYEF